MVAVDKVVSALEDPRDTHHNEQLAVEDLEEKMYREKYEREQMLLGIQMRNISYHLLLRLLVDPADRDIGVDHLKTQ